MHPLIRLICFIIFAAFVSLGQTGVILLGFTLLGLVWLGSKQAPSAKAWRMLKRMRIFYLSILLVYLGFTPGEIIFPSVADWSPTYEGLQQAVERILALALLVLAVETLLRLTHRSLLLSGLYYLATPLVCLGLDRNQFIVRIILTLDLVTSEPMKRKKMPKKAFKRYLNDITQQLADKIIDTMNIEKNNKTLIFELEAPPGKLEWIWPICLLVLFLLFSS